MNKKLRVLVLEDIPADAVLIDRELRKGGLEFKSRRVDTKTEFLDEIEHHTPDLILSDHGLPSFDGFTALALARDRCPEVPFIFVTSSLGEEMTIETFENGAVDYVLKHRLPSLVPAVRRALQKADQEAKRKAAETERERLIEELQDTLAHVKILSGLLPICSCCKKIRNSRGEWKSLEIYLEEHSEATFTHGFCADCLHKYYPEISVDKK